jgi:membrane protein required for colicin V production
MFGVVRGFILVVIPYMFYEAFFPDPAQQLPWVREAQSLPYLKSTGNTLKTVLVRYVPSSLSAPPGEQQGALPLGSGTNAALTPTGAYHISVTWRTGWPAA